MATQPCDACGEDFTPKRRKNASPFCSQACRVWRAHHSTGMRHAGNRPCGSCGVSIAHRQYGAKWCEGCAALGGKQPASTRAIHCAGCTQPFETAKPNQRYCSPECSRRANRRRWRKGQRVRLDCDHCGSTFVGSPRRVGDPERRSRYCSAECQAEGKRWRYLKTTSVKVPWANCPDCGRSFIARAGARCPTCPARAEQGPSRRWFMGWCLQCGDPFTSLQREARYCSRRCLSRAAKDRRAMRERGACIGEEVHRQTVYERDAWTCQLCKESVDRKARPPDPWSPTLDHIIPLAQGGKHSYANVQLAHFWCNSVKGADPARAELLAA